MNPKVELQKEKKKIRDLKQIRQDDGMYDLFIIIYYHHSIWVNLAVKVVFEYI